MQDITLHRNRFIW